MKIYLIEQKIYPNHKDECITIIVIYHAMSLTVLYIDIDNF